MNIRKREKGVALLTAILVIVSVMGLSLGLMYMTLADYKESEFNRDIVKATALAEAATEQAHKDLLVATANYRPAPTAGTAVVGGTAVPYTIAPVGSSRVEVDDQGVQTLIQPYSIAANGVSNGLTKHVEKVIDVEKTPIFQYVVFYNSDLEVLPGPSMNLYGRVHSNGDMYIGCGGTLTLNTNYVHAAGEMYRRRKNDGTASEGLVKIKKLGSANYLNMERKDQLAAPSVSGFDGDFDGYDADGDGSFNGVHDYKDWKLRSLDLWNGTVQTAEHGVTQIESPSVGAIKPYVEAPGGTGGDYEYDDSTGAYYEVVPGTGAYEKGYFYSNADLSIIDNKVYDSLGNEITVWPDVTGDGVGDSPVKETTLYDGRENKYVKTTTVDMEVLGKSGYWPDNGLLYATRTDSDADHPNGVKVTNAEALAGPLTVVSDTPVYTQGDYNVGDGTTPKQPASVITDSFNILSNAWNGSKTPGHLPSASETTVNCAFISGSYDTTPGAYNGGFENLPRFHENWNGVPCHIRGSFVNIWDSDVGQGEWVYGGDNYTAPGRDWNYDADFNDITKLPPFTPSVVGTTRVVWVSR